MAAPPAPVVVPPPAPVPAPVPVATSAEGCASGECLPEVEPEEKSDPGVRALPPATRWRNAVEAVKESSPRAGKSLAFGRLVKLDAGAVTLSFPREAGFHRATVMGTHKQALEKLISDQLRAPTRLLTDDSEAAFAAASPSLAEEEAKVRETREKGIEAKVRSHPAVRSALKILGGELEHVQVIEGGAAAAGDSESEQPE